MEFEPWLLIFVPIIFALGWLAARFDVRQLLKENKSLPDSYFKGLNFLLEEEHDKAIAAFVEVARLDPETIDLHFALGSLFRRRGEIERAIYVHQSLLSREDLPLKDREKALFEIAQDYLKSGMYDRAEETFKMVQSGSYAEQATRSLIHIYEIVHDWPNAIEAVNQWARLSHESIPQVIHYYCEMAQVYMSTDPEKTQEYLQLAQQALKRFETPAARARLNILLAQFNALNVLSARQYYLDILTHSPEYAGLIAPAMIQNYAHTQEQAIAFDLLEKHFMQYPNVDLFTAVSKALYAHDPEKARQFARQALRLMPSLLALEKTLSMEKELASLTDDVGLLYNIIRRDSQKLDKYHCHSCGFDAKIFYWQCPGCNKWETYSPKKGELL
ncbi:lipopolysaccharide assembly protein LapB [Basilea psittacipulmonis]|uniref:Lipopolysaccharide assembly protein B n=1 Tax=Basilea psittacipulmonis DSM 24701 TaxID=1072685 RepID=A0A077DHC8_9BURK|nr:lipopolysaccharide assembly protein LapB [Basilea psittacipulmonis]AIL32912.1 hypothetical protein IX83_05920 [Basilea psittacipulmonis DSM 24701]